MGLSLRGKSTKLPRIEPKTANEACQWLKPTISKAVSDNLRKR
jgi:hypothetical protein